MNAIREPLPPRRRPLPAVFLAAFALLASPAAHAATMHVKADATGANDGSSWANAFTSLQPAIASAQHGDEVWVAAGTYRPTSWPNGGSGVRLMHFSLRTGVAVLGGFAGTETEAGGRNPAANPTLLCGDIGVAGDASDNCHHVFWHPAGTGLDATAVLDGFTIANGNANGNLEHRYGGGMYNHGSSPTLADCVFVGNAAGSAGRGGGMANRAGSTPALLGCAFSGNAAAGMGGGMWNDGSSPTLVDCIFVGNTAGAGGHGGGMANTGGASPALSGCAFDANAAGNSGGGLYAEGSSPTLVDCAFTDNAAWRGAGMRNLGVSAAMAMTGCSFEGNAATSHGGGVWNDASSPRIFRGTFLGNTAAAGARGGAMANTGASSPLIEECAFDGNAAGNGGGAVWNDAALPEIIGCAFVDNTAWRGGAMVNSAGAAPAVVNSTFSANVAASHGGAIWNDGASPDILNCTFAGNLRGGGAQGDAVYSSGSSSPTVRNSLLWGSNAQVSGTAALAWCVVQGGHAGGTDIIIVDPQLGELDDNGGPTLTHAVPEDSSAVALPVGSAAWTDCPATDQRGEPRPAASPRAIGAYDPGEPAVSHAVAFQAGANGSLLGNASQSVPHGGSSSPVEAVPDPGYRFVAWAAVAGAGNGAFDPGANPLSVAAVVGPITVSASFVEDTPETTTLTMAATGGGTTDPAPGPHSVDVGEPVPVSALPETGHSFVEWTVTAGTAAVANPLDPETTVTLGDSAGATVQASFAINAYTVTFDLDGKGTRTGGGELVQQVEHGQAAIAPAVAAAAGWIFTGWDVAFGSVTADLTVTAQYEVATYTVTFIAGSNGTVSGSAVQTVAHGGNCAPVEAEPDQGHLFAAWTGDHVGTENPLTVTNVTADMAVTANFDPDPGAIVIQVTWPAEGEVIR
jgi:hypothetical protein